MAEFLEEIKVNLRFGLLYGAENKNPSTELGCLHFAGYLVQGLKYLI